MFYLGTSGYNVCAMAYFLGIPGGWSWERTFSCHSKTIHTLIITIRDEILKKAFEDEVIATLRETLKDKCISNEIEQFVQTKIKNWQITWRNTKNWDSSELCYGLE